MTHILLKWSAAGILAAAMVCAGLSFPQTAFAGTTGIITGVVSDSSGKPLADVSVTAAAASGTGHATTDAKGFYSILDLVPDTYTVSFQKQGFQDASVPGIVVLQDQTQRLNQTMQTALKTIASVRAEGSSNLVKPNTGSDVYTVSGQELTAATNPVNSLETIYQWMAVAPGVSTTIGSQPRVRGGQVTDLGYEFEGIPIQDRIVGFFTTNLSNTGLSNVEVYTGGLAGAGAVNGTGYFNSVLKTGTYPGFTSFGIQASSPEANQYLQFERGWATPDHRWSYYFGFTGVNSQNQYDYGELVFPGVVFCCDGPGPVKERNWVANIHYKPSLNDDLQLVWTNDLGEFDFNYLLTRTAGEPLPVSLVPCAGATSSWAGGQFPTSGAPTTGTFGMGGTAPNGQPCPLGLAYGNLGSGQGNIWHHYGGLGKIQWAHNINEHSSLTMRLDENYNEYIFDQPMADPNIPSLEVPGAPYNWLGCSNYPLKAGTPVPEPPGDPFDMCAYFDGIQSFWGNRRSNMWQAAADYTNAINDHITLKAGASDEYDHNTFNYLIEDVFTLVPNGTASGAPIWPGIDEESDYPTTQIVAYLNPDLRFGKFLLSPGVTYAQRHYGFPADTGYIGYPYGTEGKTITAADIYSGGYTAHAVDPTFNGTYSIDPENVFSFSWGDTTSFISSGYIYTSSMALYSGYDGGHTIRNPFIPGTTFQPQQNHAAELLFEHNFGGGTTMRVGPYFNKTTNYYAEYNPFAGFFLGPNSSNPCTGSKTGNFSSCTPCAPGTVNCAGFYSVNTILSNNNEHQDFGIEFGLNHVDVRPRGVSYWISATYDNFWDTATDISGAYINFPLPSNIIDSGMRVRAGSNPLWTATALADFHNDRFHFDPLISYQGDTFFNNGLYFDPSGSECLDKNGLPYICQNEQIAHGWWTVNTTAYEELGVKRNYYLGLTVDNLFDNVEDKTPCFSGGNGCYPFNSPQSGVTNQLGNIYQNYSQTPRTFYFFAGVKM